MSEDAFRIVVAAAVALAAVAFVVQACVVIALYLGSKKTQQKIGEFVEKAEPIFAKFEPLIEDVGPILKRIGPVIDKIGPAVEKLGPVADKVGVMVDNATSVIRTSNRILEDSRPRIVEITDDTAAIAKTGREQVERLGTLLHDAGERAQNRLAQIDHVVESTIEQIEQVGDSVKHAGDSVKRSVLKPVKEVNGLAAGISAAMSTLVHGSRKSSVDSATQDEEMFI